MQKLIQKRNVLKRYSLFPKGGVTNLGRKEEMSYHVKKPIVIQSDNQAAIKIATNDVEHDRTKHIDIKYHFIRDTIKAKQIQIEWIRTEKQVADIFTKSLSLPSFAAHRQRLLCKAENTIPSDGSSMIQNKQAQLKM